MRRLGSKKGLRFAISGEAKKEAAGHDVARYNVTWTI